LLFVNKGVFYLYDPTPGFSVYAKTRAALWRNFDELFGPPVGSSWLNSGTCFNDKDENSA